MNFFIIESNITVFSVLIYVGLRRVSSRTFSQLVSHDSVGCGTGILSPHKLTVVPPEAVLLVDGAPYPAAGLPRVAGVPLRVQGQVHVHTVVTLLI